LDEGRAPSREPDDDDDVYLINYNMAVENLSPY
jgi:hypothetical protein